MLEVLFLDIGGVLLSNGWDHLLRKKVATQFQIEWEEMEKRHALIFPDFELGFLSFDAYLNQVIFYKKRSFSLAEIKQTILDAATPFPDMINFVQEIKHEYKLKVVALSNEGKEIGEDRIKRFDLRSFIDFFAISSFVSLRKPDMRIYQLALNLTQTDPKHACYIDDRELLIEAGKQCGIISIHHKTKRETEEKFLSLFSKKSLK